MLWVRPLLVLAAFAVFPLSTCDEFFGHHNGKVYERGSMAAVESEEVSSGSSEYDDDRTNKQPAADGNERPTKRVERAGQQSLPSAVNVGVGESMYCFLPLSRPLDINIGLNFQTLMQMEGPMERKTNAYLWVSSEI